MTTSLVIVRSWRLLALLLIGVPCLANLARVFSSIVADPTRVYDSSSRDDLEYFMYDLDALVSAGILENHDFKITVLQPLIRYSS